MEDLGLGAYSGGTDPRDANDMWFLASAPELEADDPEWSLPKAAGKLAAEEAAKRHLEPREQ